MVRYLFYTIGDLTYQSPLVYSPSSALWLLSTSPKRLPLEIFNFWSSLRTFEWTEWSERQQYGEACWRRRRMTYNHKNIRRDTIRRISFVTSVKQLYVFLFLKELFFWDDMLCRWVNIWRSIVPPCSGSNTPRRLLDSRKSSKSL